MIISVVQNSTKTNKKTFTYTHLFIDSNGGVNCNLLRLT